MLPHVRQVGPHVWAHVTQVRWQVKLQVAAHVTQVALQVTLHVRRQVRQVGPQVGRQLIWQVPAHVTLQLGPHVSGPQVFSGHCVILHVGRCEGHAMPHVPW